MSTFTYKTLIIAALAALIDTGTLAESASYTEGTVLGKITCGAITASAITGTGNATIGTLSRKTNCQPGVYRAQCIAATKFNVYDPSGKWVGQGTFGVAFDTQIGFTITAGGVACVAGDYFDLTVAAGSGKLKIVDSTNTDGSDRPFGVLAEDVDATDSDKPVNYYASGVVLNEAALTFGGTDVIATHRTALRAIGLPTKTIAA